MLLSLLQQFDIALSDFLFILGSVGLGLFFALCGLCLPLGALAAEVFYVGSRKAVYDKCALQTAQTAFASGLFICLLLSLCLALARALLPPEATLPSLLSRPELPLFPPLVFLCLLGLYLYTWTPLKKIRALHLLLGLVAALSGPLLLFCALLLLGGMQQPEVVDLLFEAPLEILQSLVEDFLRLPHQWGMFAFLLFTGLASGFALNQLWLFARRAKADYGRDYYAFALRRLARCASGFTLAAAAMGASIFYRLYTATPADFRQPPDPGVLVVAFGLPLVSCLLWFLIIKSDTPMRHKAGALFGCLFLFVALCAQLAALVSTFPRL
ncbi:hypothetical protein LJC15_02000 [Desulfovibrio sp. OttesenSCG-928-G11]|nr:hypothetical protein [Desulfovibrio sp. OttesenSCG-928-G11]